MPDLIERISIKTSENVISRFEGTHFNSLTVISVDEGFDAVFFLSGKVLDVLSAGEYTLEYVNIPKTYAALGRNAGDMTEFDCGVCFVNKNAEFAFDWEKSDGEKGNCTVKVSDTEKFAALLLSATDLENTSAADLLRDLVAEGEDLEKAGVTANIQVTFKPEPVAYVEEKPEPEPAPVTKEEPEPEKETKTKSGKSPFRHVAIGALTVGVLICLGVAVFLRPADKPDDTNTPGTVISEGMPEVPDINADVTHTDIATAKDGDFVLFGSYEQDGDTANGAEAMTWEVLAEDETSVTLISRHGLDAVPFNSTYSTVQWRDCSLRKWLQGDFYNTAFTETEKARILTTVNQNETDTDYGIEDGNNTEDTVYILNTEEAKNIFNGAELFRRAKATPYAISKGAYVDETQDNCCRYWLRSQGDTPETAAFVENDGYVATYGDGVTNPIMAVRPVIRVSR